MWRQRPSPYFSSKCNTQGLLTFEELREWQRFYKRGDTRRRLEGKKIKISSGKVLIWHKQAAIDQKGQKMWGMSLWKPTVRCLRRVWWKIHCLQQKLSNEKKSRTIDYLFHCCWGHMNNWFLFLHYLGISLSKYSVVQFVTHSKNMIAPPLTGIT